MKCNVIPLCPPWDVNICFIVHIRPLVIEWTILLSDPALGFQIQASWLLPADPLHTTFHNLATKQLQQERVYFHPQV